MVEEKNLEVETKNLPYSFDDIRSPLKFFILKKIREKGSITANELGEYLQTDSKTPETHAGKYLLQYHRQGLLKRRKEHKYYVYELSESGEERLNYFKKKVEG